MEMENSQNFQKSFQNIGWDGKVDSILITKFKGVSQVQRIVNFFTNDRHAVFLVFEKDLGYFYWVEGMPFPNLYYVLPIYVYPINPSEGIGSVQFLRISKNQFENKLYPIYEELKKDGKKITDVDIKVSCEDEKYQKLNFIPLSKCMWKERRDPKEIEFIKEEYKKYKLLIKESVARSVTLDEYEELKRKKENSNLNGIVMPNFISNNNMDMIKEGKEEVIKLNDMSIDQEFDIFNDESLKEEEF